MKFHSVHGANICVDEGSSRASRVASFCDGLAFSAKPLSVNSRTTLVLGANEEWSGALRLGVTSHDPSSLRTPLPRYVCPDLAGSQPGFWARPLPETWAAHGNKLTFYLNNSGQLQLFVNGEHKGALLTGLPHKDPLWLLLDLYGITVSAKFIATTSSAPVEVLSRGPEALQAYRELCSEGSVSLNRVRVALIGPCAAGKSTLKKALLRMGNDDESSGHGKPAIDIIPVCQTDTDVWKVVPTSSTSSATSSGHFIESPDLLLSEEEYHRAIAVNVVREVLSHRRKKHHEDKKKTPLVRSALKLQSTLTKKKEDAGPASSYCCANKNFVGGSLTELPPELPTPVTEMVDKMLAEAETKQDWDQIETEKQATLSTPTLFHVWDFNGHPRLLPLHQLFFSPQAIYLLVFDLSRDLDEPLLPPDDFPGMEFSVSQDVSTLHLIHLWLAAIHASISHGGEDGAVLPPVLLVGTHRLAVYRNLEVKETFARIRRSLQGLPYAGHVVSREVALELGGGIWATEDGTEIREFSEDDEEIEESVHVLEAGTSSPPREEPSQDDAIVYDEQVEALRRLLSEVSSRLPHMGMEIPVKWLAFERSLERLQKRGLELIDRLQLEEVARIEEVEGEEGFSAMLEFLHHQGRLWHSDTMDGLVAIQPHWLVDRLAQPFVSSVATGVGDMVAGAEGGGGAPDPREAGILTSDTLDAMWNDHHRNSLVALLEAMDLLCELEPTKDPGHLDDVDGRCFLVPWMSHLEEGGSDEASAAPTVGTGALVLVVDFGQTLPPGLVSRLLVRLCRWSEQHNWQKRPHVARRGGSRICVDHCHDLIVRKLGSPSNKIQVILTRSDHDGYDGTLPAQVLPSSHICAKVKYLLESELDALKERWYKRLAFTLGVPCPCDKMCDLHRVAACPQDQCVHILPLTECLARRSVECEYRRVKTEFVQRYFPEVAPNDVEFGMLEEPVEKVEPRGQPLWTRSIAKLLSYGQSGKDWLALSRRLGYNERELLRFGEELNPSLVLLKDWLDSNGHTRYCIELLVSCLEQIGRGDVAQAVRSEAGPDLTPPPPVFLSYQWDSQESALNLRRRLELAGYPCWMDVGNMGGGDSLYGKIYEGISRAKVFLCCLTPKYATSPTCAREASLADVLRIPVVPVMLEPTPWPPQGPLAVLLSPLVYIDLCGVGGHGGSGGRQADWEARFQDILDRLSHFASPVFPRNVSPPSCNRVVLPPGSGSQRKIAEGSLSSDFLLLGEAAGPLPDDREDSLPSNGEAAPGQAPNEAGPVAGRAEADANSNRSGNYPEQLPPPPPRVVNRVVRCHICLLL